MIHYNFGKAVQYKEFKRTAALNSPPTVLLTAVTKLSTDHKGKGSHITKVVPLIINKNPRLRGDIPTSRH